MGERYMGEVGDERVWRWKRYGWGRRKVRGCGDGKVRGEEAGELGARMHRRKLWESGIWVRRRTKLRRVMRRNGLARGVNGENGLKWQPAGS
ncbi:MAG TPA: hypothetical protein VG101_09300 [Puia sp.]|nr:hypothetical protein [Puia sp.]